MNQREIKFRAWHKEQKKMYSPEEMGKDQLTLMPDNRGFANIHVFLFQKTRTFL